MPSTLVLETQAKQILMAIAADIESSASSSSSSAVVTVRAALRASPDFDLRQVSEALRLLRAIVPAAWEPDDAQGRAELHYFHSAIDSAVNEAIAQHALQVERTRALFLGMLGHDLRTPLSAIKMACHYIARDDAPMERKLEAAVRISRCASTMEGMIRDVLDFARSRLGKNMAVTAMPADLASVCREAVEDARAEHPRCEFRFDATGRLDAAADATRLRQALRNLLDSAARNGARGMPIRFNANGGEDGITFQVKCEGPALAADTLRTMFDPIAQLAIAGANPDGNPPADLGLELFVAREILRAHGGDVTITSLDQDGTVFEATLPRR